MNMDQQFIVTTWQPAAGQTRRGLELYAYVQIQAATA